MGNTYLTVRTHPRSVTWSPTRDSPPSEPCGVVGVSGLGFRARSGGARRKAAVRFGFACITADRSGGKTWIAQRGTSQVTTPLRMRTAWP